MDLSDDTTQSSLRNDFVVSDSSLRRELPDAPLRLFLVVLVDERLGKKRPSRR